MKRVYTLYRVSTKKQVNISENHDNDIPMQRGACKEFVKFMRFLIKYGVPAHQHICLMHRPHGKNRHIF